MQICFDKSKMSETFNGIQYNSIYNFHSIEWKVKFIK